MTEHTVFDTVVTVEPARTEWLEALILGDDVFSERFGIAVAPEWVGFPEALPRALAAALREPSNLWGTHLFFDSVNGALVGIGGFKGAPSNGEVELGYAVAPSRQGRGIASAAVSELVSRAAAAGVAVVVAHTLASDGPSTSVLRKNNFMHASVIPDPQHGSIWRWERRLLYQGRTIE